MTPILDCRCQQPIRFYNLYWAEQYVRESFRARGLVANIVPRTTEPGVFETQTIEIG